MRIYASATLLLAAVLLVSSCTSNQPPPSLEKIASDFAPMECRAITLREQRFALANEIRFTQDTLIRANGNVDTARLQSKLGRLNMEKERMTQQSLQLADSIKQTLDSLMSHYLTQQQDKEQFNQLLNAKLKDMHCKDSL